MTTTVKFGVDSSCRLALGDHTRLAPDAASCPLVADAAGEVQAALAQPQGFPPLAAATVPGDRVTVALDPEAPCLAEILRGAIRALVAAGVDLSRVTVVAGGPIDGQEQLAGELAAAVGASIDFQRHNPDDERALSMLGTTAAGRPLRLNRTLVESDFVLPIVAARRIVSDSSEAPKFGGLFPQFSNRETIERYDTGASDATRKRRAEQTAEANKAGWLLGVWLMVAVVPGPAGRVSAVLAGEPGLVAREADARFRAIWERSARQQGDLVIAAIGGGDEEQTWDNLARAIEASEGVLLPDGAIAVCSNLAELPNGCLNRLVDAVDLAAAQRELRHDAAHNARSAIVLAQALERGPVYLKSRLPAEIVESLGMTPIGSDAELSRLAATRRHCVVIEEAQRLRPQFVGAAS